MKAKFILFEPSNFEGYPTGGSGTFSKNVIELFGNEVALVGITTSKEDRVGAWTKKVISDKEFDYFPVRYVKKNYSKKPLIPARLKWFLGLRKNKKDILRYDCSNVFIQSQDSLLAIYGWPYTNICYRFAGLTNPLSMSRYKWVRLFDNFFEHYYIPKLKYVNTILAADSKEEIEIYSRKLETYGIKNTIKQFPTRVDTNIFYPMHKKVELRSKFGYGEHSKIVITTGRLSVVKGWQLLLDSFLFFQKEFLNSYFIFVGNGEEKNNIEAYVRKLGLVEQVKLVGYQDKTSLAELLNISDIYVMGSFYEGWPTSMVEALACGVPICSTNFGSAKEILHANIFGITVSDRDPINFANSMKQAINNNFVEDLYLKEMDKYSLKNFRDELSSHWQI